MRTIQEVGTEILSNNPKSLYIFGGSEYGIKMKYLSMLKDYYKGDVVEVPAMDEIIHLMSTKHFVPLTPRLYIIRYDENFVTSLNESLASKIKSLRIIGTIVCIYESAKHITKLDKFLSDYVVLIDDVNVNFKIKYLHADFPKLPDKLIELSARYADNYGEAQKICMCMSTIPPESLFALSDADIMKLFGKQDSISEDQLRIGVASRNLPYLLDILDQYENLDNVFYTILSTLLELEKLLYNSYTQSSLREYVKRWNELDIYNMFMNTYEALKQSRSVASSDDTKYLIMYLFSLLKFKPIPAVESMED